MSAATAIQSVAHPPTASTRNTPLTAIDTPMFCLMIRRVSCESWIANESFERSSPMSAMSAVSSATSVPAAPIATPTVAAANAGASLTPSPTDRRCAAPSTAP